MRIIGFLLGLATVAANQLRGHRKLKRSDNKDGIASQYIVRFAKTVPNAKKKALALTEGSEGAEVLFDYNAIFKGACIAGVSEDLLEKILDDEEVLFIEQDEVVTTDDEEEENNNSTMQVVDYSFAAAKTGRQRDPVSWGLDRIDQKDLPLDSMYLYGDATGQGVTVFVLDSGIEASHKEFEGRASCATSFVRGERCKDVRGHGTHVSAIIGGSTFGVAKGVTIEGIKVIDKNGASSYSVILAGISYVILTRLLRFWDPPPTVMNLSLGGKKHIMLNTAINVAAQLGVVVVASAGNFDDNACKFSPGSAFGAIAVGSTNPDDSRSSFSNKGPCVNMFAPGTNIESAGIDSDSSIRSGTSMASPHVAGAAAVYMEKYPKLKASKIRQKLLNGAARGIVTDAGLFSHNRLLQIDSDD